MMEPCTGLWPIEPDPAKPVAAPAGAVGISVNTPGNVHMRLTHGAATKVFLTPGQIYPAAVAEIYWHGTQATGIVVWVR